MEGKDNILASDNILIEFAKAKKNKYCPMVEVVND